MFNINRKQTQIKELCQKFKIAKLELFGSAVRDDFDESSDLDFIVEFLDEQQVFDRYFDFKEALEILFSRKVDLVMPEAIKNKYFRKSIEQERKAIYET